MATKKRSASKVTRTAPGSGNHATGAENARSSVFHAGVAAGKAEAKRGNTKKQKSGGSLYNAGANMAKAFSSNGNKSAVEIRKAAQKKRTSR